VLLDHATLQLPLRGISERVGPASAQEFQFRKQLENRNDPGSQTHLAWMAGDRIARRKQRRRQMKGNAAAIETLSEPGKEAGFHMKTRDLIFVLVSKQLVKAARHRFRQFGRA